MLRVEFMNETASCNDGVTRNCRKLLEQNKNQSLQVNLLRLKNLGQREKELNPLLSGELRWFLHARNAGWTLASEQVVEQFGHCFDTLFGANWHFIKHPDILSRN